MKNDSYIIVYLITNIFNVFVLHRFIRTFFEKKCFKLFICILSYLSYFFVSSLCYLYVDIPIVALIVNWCLVFGVSLNYDASMLKRLLSCSYIVLFAIIPEIIVSAWIGYFHYSIFTQGNFSNSMGLIAARLITYVEALLLYNFQSVRRSHKVKGSVWFASVAIPVITFVLYVFIVQSEDVTKNKMIVATMLIYLINITVFYLYDSLTHSYIKLANNVVLEKERELYYHQCAMMQNSNEELRAFRHDINNHLIGVSELLENQKYEEVKNLVEGLLGKINSKILFSTTGNIPIDSIINYKLQNATNEQIRVETEIAVPADFDMDISDCITILGNLLDNALFAVRQLDEGERYLNLKLINSKGRLMIQCINPYSAEIMYENGKIVSSNMDRELHGYGLKNIERIVEKYNGYMSIGHENHVFVVNMLLYFPVDCNN